MINPEHSVGHPTASFVFLAAGLLPSLFSSSTLSAIYFALLIPPAAYHCYITVRDWFKKSPPGDTKKSLDK